MIKLKPSNAIQVGLHKQIIIEIAASGDWTDVAVAASDIVSRVFGEFAPVDSNTYFLCYFEKEQVNGTVLYQVDDAGATSQEYTDINGRTHNFYNGTTNVYPQKGDVVQIFIQGSSNGGTGTSVPDATTSVKGIVELATQAEAQTGTDTERAVTPSGLPVIAASNKFADRNVSSYGGSNIVTLGNQSSGDGNSGVAIGHYASANAYQGVGVGYQANAAGEYSVAIGASAVASAAGDQGIAIGLNAGAYAAFGIAIGRYARATASKAAALGYYVQNSDADTVKLGVDGTEWIQFNDFTPTAGVLTGTHWVTVAFNGGSYKILLSNA